MGDRQGWEQPSGLIAPNGLLRGETDSLNTVLDLERWSKAEQRIAELIDCIQPNELSEERRNAVAGYVQGLITKCFSCQVFTFGSVPLKTYLPDGDIDLTVFSDDQSLKDTWAIKVRDMLENEERSENAEFRVKEVQYIQAEVKLVKCLVENIVVDISFNQLGGLCTLCFLEEVDNLVRQNHLFKRSIILIKAWCYYESRILGAHHGLISTYALEILVLYIFHVFNNSFVGPLEVLYRFLEFFSNFDWDSFCVSLWGPVPINSLPDMRAEHPRKDNGELLLSKLFLDSCSSVYSVFSGSQENQGQSFVSKHFNVVDPLRTNNNLGRSVSKGNFFRIRSAFAFGAKKLSRLLECPKENIITEVNQFFTNTWDRQGSGCRPDAPSASIRLLRSLLDSDYIYASDNGKNHQNNKKKNEIYSSYASSADGTQILRGLSSQHGSSGILSRSNNALAASRTQGQRSYGNPTTSRVPDQAAHSIESALTAKDTKSCRADYMMNGVRGRYQFARTQSSPELTDTSNDVPSQLRHNRVLDGRSQVASKPDYSGRKNLGSEVSGTHGTKNSTDDPSSLRHRSLPQSLDAASNSKTPSGYYDEAGLGLLREELASVANSRDMHQEEQDLVNMMASSRLHGLGGHVLSPMNFIHSHIPLQSSPSALAPTGYQESLVGMPLANFPLVGSHWGSMIQFPQSQVSSPLPHHFPSIGLTSNTEEMIESSINDSAMTNSNQKADCGSRRDFVSDTGGSQVLQLDDNEQSPSTGSNFVHLSTKSTGSSSFLRGQQKVAKENKGFRRAEIGNSLPRQNNRQEEVYVADRNPNPKIISPSQVSSSRSKVSSESSWDASSVKTSKSIRDRRGRKAPSPVPSTVYGKGNNGWHDTPVLMDHASSKAEADSRDWTPLSTLNTEMEERTTGPTPVTSAHSRIHRVPDYEPPQIKETKAPVPPTLGSPDSHQRTMDNSGVVPFAFYLTGPPVPFLAMLPFYNLPAERGNSDGFTGIFDGEEVLDDIHINQLEDDSHSKIFHHSSSTKHSSLLPSERSDETHKSDFLHSDFKSHWKNLQYGRFCQNPPYHGPLSYPSPVMVPPVYLQGQFPWEGSGRPSSTNANIFSQLMTYGSRFIPDQPGSLRPTSVHQHYGDGVPRYRAGTGTYLPNTKTSLGYSTTRNHQGNYNSDNIDHHSEQEGNWNHSSRPRASGRSYSRSQVKRLASRSVRLLPNENQAEGARESYRRDSFASYRSQNG